jgi:regulator of nucleoside diphosphate kinase
MQNRPIIITDADRHRLEAMIESLRDNAGLRIDSLAALEGELKRARVVPQSDVHPEVVTMNSVVRLRDLVSDETQEYELVYPADADVSRDRISVLAPVGTAILGYRRGDVIEWPVPAGLRRLRVEEVLYQPGRAGALHRETGSGYDSPAAPHGPPVTSAE